MVYKVVVTKEAEADLEHFIRYLLFEKCRILYTNEDEVFIIFSNILFFIKLTNSFS